MTKHEREQTKTTPRAWAPGRWARAAAVSSAVLFLAGPASAQGLPVSQPQAPKDPTAGKLDPSNAVIKADLVPTFTTSSLMREMTTAPVRVAPDGRTENKHILPMIHCERLAPGASTNHFFPEIRWGVKNNSLAGEVSRPFTIKLRWPGQPEQTQRVPSLAKGEQKTFKLERPEPIMVQVTRFQVPAKAKPTPVPTQPPDPNSTGRRVISPGPGSIRPDDIAQERCVSSLFVKDPTVTVIVDSEGVVSETDEGNNSRAF